MQAYILAHESKSVQSFSHLQRPPLCEACDHRAFHRPVRERRAAPIPVPVAWQASRCMALLNHEIRWPRPFPPRVSPCRRVVWRLSDLRLAAVEAESHHSARRTPLLSGSGPTAAPRSVRWVCHLVIASPLLIGQAPVDNGRTKLWTSSWPWRGRKFWNPP